MTPLKNKEEAGGKLLNTVSVPSVSFLSIYMKAFNKQIKRKVSQNCRLILLSYKELRRSSHCHRKFIYFALWFLALLDR